MSVAKRHILPFFIPHLGCPNQCIFCDQRRISGQCKAVQPSDLTAALAGLTDDAEIKPELAFYGGSFTAIDENLQTEFLQVAYQALRRGKISGIRISTRPDAIDRQICERLRAYGVGTVELGVQSMTDDTLVAARRGHTAEASVAALRMLKSHGFVSGVQLMPGLPREPVEAVVGGARRILVERPDMLRIYPTVVVAGTALAAMYEAGEFVPLGLDEAVEISLRIKLLAEHYGVAVIRTGLQPTEELAGEVVAGPYHPAFGFLVQAAMWREKLKMALADFPQARECFVNKRDIAAVIGEKRANLRCYPPNLRIRGAELPQGSLRLADRAGDEYLLSDEEFRRRLMVAF